MEKIEDEFGSTPIGSADFPGDIGGVVNYSSTFSGSTGRVSVPYVDYIEYYIIINGTTSTYTHQLRAMEGAVREGAPFPTDLANAITNMEYIDTAYRLAGFPRRESTLG